MRRLPTLAGFAILQPLLCAFVFGDALWGRSLLAPVDIAPALFSKYRYMDPASIGVPANHHTIDQLTFDLPIQYTIYQTYRRGEVPWWDPYTFGGWAMLADAHTNGTDFTRLLMYALLPFEPAYNWTRILHFVLCGLGMFLLLRRLGFRELTCLGLSAAYEFGGSLSVFFEHPWIQSSFVYYPFLWLAWDGAFRQGGLRYTLLAALAVTGVLYSGSLQTDSYLVLFSASFFCAYGGRNWANWKRLIGPIGLAGIVGTCLAAPAWLSQLELFLNSNRSVPLLRSNWSWLSGPGSLTAFYPWCLGTFRTLDLAKYFGQRLLGFHVYIGSIALVLAALGIWYRCSDPLTAPARRLALALVGLYLLILSTPLLDVFYMRCATLATMGLVVLAAHGLENLQQDGDPFRRTGRGMVVMGLVLAVGVHVVAFVIYPRLVPQVKQLVEQRSQTNESLDSAPALRRFQVENLPAEISFRNAEALLGWLGIMALAAVLLRPACRRRPAVWAGLVALNLWPVLLFSHRYIPHQTIPLWQRLRAGGPEQQRVATTLAGTAQRLWEVAPGNHEMVMPAELPHLYRVRTLHGYSSLRPRSLLGLPASELEKWRPQTADWIYQSNARGLPTGELSRNATPGLARFQWRGQQVRPFTVQDVGLSQIHLSFEPGESGRLLWTDSWYPGWQAKVDGRPVVLEKAAPCFSSLEVPANAQTLVLQYRPRFLSAGLAMAAAGLFLSAVLGVVALRRRSPG